VELALYLIDATFYIIHSLTGSQCYGTSTEMMCDLCGAPVATLSNLFSTIYSQSRFTADAS